MFMLVYKNQAQGNMTKYKKFESKQAMEQFKHYLFEMDHITILESYKMN